MGNGQAKKKEEKVIPLKRKIKIPGEQITLTPITPLFHTDINYDFFTHAGEEISKEMNYGIIPVECVHEILLYLNPSELVGAFQSCKLVYEVSKTNLWWKTYYDNYFKNDEDVSEDLPVGDDYQVQNISWKKMFFKRYYFLTDCFYRTKYSKIQNPPKTKEEIRNYVLPDPNTDICVVLIGKKSDHFLRNLKKEYHVFKRKGKPKIDSLYFSRDGSQQQQSSIGLRKFTGEKIFARRERYVLGCFLCFDVHDKKDYRHTLNLYTQMREEGHLDGFHLGLLCGMVLIKEEGERGVGETEREVVYDVGCQQSQKMNLLGYIETDALEGENFVLCFGIMIDGLMRREKKKQMILARRRMRRRVRRRAARGARKK